MKKIESFFNGLTKWHGWALVLYSIIIVGFSYSDVLQQTITLTYLQLLLLVSFPHLLFYALRLFWLRQKRVYKAGDFVNILADERKFMVIKYLNFYPLHAVCKEVNSTDCLSLNQKYLTFWVENEKTFNINSIFKRNINTVVPTSKITRL